MFRDVKTYSAIEDGNLITGTVQDCTPYAERAKALQNEGFHGSKDMKLAATIPFVMVEKYCNDNNITYRECMTNREHMRRILNDPANAHFRVWPGKL